MRLVLSFLLVSFAIATANPKAVVELPAYELASERVLVTLRDTNADIKATFTFRPKGRGHFSVSLPIWLPERGLEPVNSALMRKRLSPNGHIDNETKDLLDGLLAVQIAASDRVVPIQRWDIVSMDDLPPSLKGFLDPDMYSLMPGFELTPTIVQQQLPITITYRQPLNFQRGESHFFYVPSLPKGSGSKRYSITVAAAPGYSISVSNGVSPAFVKDGQVTILPRDGVPIRASVRPLANEHHAADGSQPFSPAAVRESLPAGSHR